MKIQEIVETIEKEEEISEKLIVPTTERQTIVHCSHFLNAGDGIRIWKTTFLVEQLSGIKRRLLHFENITLYPQWTVADHTKNYSFTLFFEGLSESCTHFDFKEEIPQPGGFFVSNIPRNKTDVYRVTIT